MHLQAARTNIYSNTLLILWLSILNGLFATYRPVTDELFRVVKTPPLWGAISFIFN
nr:MAG TPA_asm: hypothetical protein [Caudoviricetes sp.]